jgi:glutamine amidotransferase
MIVVLDYGVGNLASIVNMFRAAGATVRASSSAEDVRAAERLVLPGVGHFDHGMRMLNRSGLRDALEESAFVQRKPVLGICLGAQMLGRASEEGTESGLGWIDMSVRRLPEVSGVRIPHMGWNQLTLKQESSLFMGMSNEARFYFVHSFFMACDDPAAVVATTTHGVEFTCAVQRENIAGVQFHPEKSLRHGLALLRNFAS